MTTAVRLFSLPVTDRTDDLGVDIGGRRTRGVAIDGEIQEMPWGRFVTRSDPGGNGVVHQAAVWAGSVGSTK